MMYRSATPPVSKDLNLPYPPPAPFGSGHRKDDSESDFLRQQQQHQSHLQMNSGLLRFRSAPSSLFGEVPEDFLPVRPSSPGADTMFTRFLTPDLRDKPSVGASQRNAHFSPPQPGAPGEEVGPQQNNVCFPSSATQMMYHPQQQQQQQMPNHSTVESPYQVVSSMAMENADQIKNGGGLIRQSSSPAGLFSHLNEANGYGMARGMVGFRNGSGSVGEAGNRLRSQISFSSRQSSIMSQISEMESEGMGGSSPEESNGGAAGRGYLPGFPVTSWEHNSLMQDSNFSGLKRNREGEGKMMAGLNPTEPQNGELRNHVSGLAHQFSLPKTSSEMAAIEKFLQFQDAVPCKVRAKRGCATHPRSIAERVRRTRISERMRKLQELVPNMDKQTNTADMLDLAVDYIKDLQRQVKALNESRANCTCSASRS